VTQPVLKMENLSHVYPDGTVAIRGISLEILEGEFTAIIGQNGAGKTTLVKHFNGLLKPTRGRVMVGDVDTSKVQASSLATQVGYVFQNPDHQLCSRTLEEEIAFGPHNLGLPEDEVQRRVEHWTKAFHLEEFKGEHPYFLPKPARQRIAIASVLAMNPKIVMLDEPTTGMDYGQSNEIFGMFKELNRAGTTFLVITHNMRIVAEHARRVVVMLDGGILMDGPVGEVFSKTDLLKKAFIVPPQITLLAQALRARNFPPDVLTVDRMYEEFNRLYKN
jgi:energy-coupling factor transport system ATP-binding protein